MEFVIVSIGILVAIVVAAAVIDLRARRSRQRLSIDTDAARDGRRLNQARADMYGMRGPGGEGGGTFGG